MVIHDLDELVPPLFAECFFGGAEGGLDVLHLGLGHDIEIDQVWFIWFPEDPAGAGIRIPT